jgi:hypothetical protein
MLLAAVAGAAFVAAGALGALALTVNGDGASAAPATETEARTKTLETVAATATVTLPPEVELDVDDISTSAAATYDSCEGSAAALASAAARYDGSVAAQAQVVRAAAEVEAECAVAAEVVDAVAAEATKTGSPELVAAVDDLAELAGEQAVEASSLPASAALSKSASAYATQARRLAARTETAERSLDRARTAAGLPPLAR